MGRARVTDWQGRPIRRQDGAASKREAKRVAELRLLERAGQIQGLTLQVKVPLMGRDGPILTPTGRQMHYVADAVYVEDGATVYEDTKGHRTEVYLLKRAILAAMGIALREV